MISTEFDSQFPLSSGPNYSLHFLPTTHISNPRGHQELFTTMQTLTTHLLNLNKTANKLTLISIPLTYSLPNNPSGSCRSLLKSTVDEFKRGRSLKNKKYTVWRTDS